MSTTTSTITRDAPAFDFYPERFWFAVEGWSDSDVTRYWRLLGQQWMRDGFPESKKELAALARGKVSARVLEKFPLGADGKRRNKFLEKLRVEQRARIAKRRLGASMTNAKRLAERNGGRAAEHDAERGEGDDASATPPPTTHHPPHPTATHTPGARLGSGLPTSEEEAIAMADTVGVPAAYAITIFNEHEGATWEDGLGRTINKFSSYIKSRYNNRVEKHAREEKRATPRNSPGAGPSRETVHALQQRIDAARERIARMNAKSFTNAEAAAAWREEREQLETNISQWKQQILNLP